MGETAVNVDVVLEDDILTAMKNLENNNEDEKSLVADDVETGQQLVFESNGDDNSASTTKPLKDTANIDSSLSRQNMIGKFINNDIVEGTILTMMITNGIMMGISTFDFVSDNAGVSQAFYLVDLIFLTIFTVELSFHIYHLGFKNFIKDSWMVFDLVLILAIWVFDIGSILKAIGALRIFRIIPRVIMLRQVVISIAAVMPNMGAVVSLLSLIMFIFSIVMTQLFG